MTTWGNKGRKSFFTKLLMRNFPSAEGLSFFQEPGLKRLPTATEAQVKQVILAQLKYAHNRAHRGGYGNDGRGIEQSGNGRGTSKTQ